MEVKEDVYEGRFSAKINAKNSIKKISCELKHEFRNHLPILSNFLPYENEILTSQSSTDLNIQRTCSKSTTEPLEKG